jgi:hypothetical protein
MTQYSRNRTTGLEQFYTPPEIANFCVSLLFEQRVINTNDIFLEPSGGTGSFINALLKNGVSEKNIISFDTHPKHPMVKKTKNSLKKTIKKTNLIVLGNPPFGRNNSLSIPFFNHFAKSAKIIAYILPKSWRKWSVQDKLDQDFWLINDVELATSFHDKNGNSLDQRTKLKTVFQIWERKAEKRPLILRTIENREYIKKVKPKEADVALTIFGYSCGRVETNFNREPNTTKMFLKIKNEKVLNALQNVDFSRFYKNTAYTEALSIKEIQFLLNEFFDKDQTG